MTDRLKKRACLIVSLLFVYLFFGAVTALAQSTVGPMMVMEEKSFDFKEVKEGDVLKHAFRVLNKGDQNLEIKKVQPG
ncbi:MAG: hypothetical protein Q7J27_00585 [Syntrophales bacterium]|nr:hypothetical protein [Syntrophales bacterium]